MKPLHSSLLTLRAAVLTLLLALGLAPATVSANPLERAADSGLSTFDDVKLPGSTSTLQMETLWERDLSTYTDDANENNHNLFICNGQLYAYLEHYNGSRRSSIRIRRFDLSTGEELPAADFPFPDKFTTDQELMLAGNGGDSFAIIGIRHNSGESGGYRNISFGTFSLDEAGTLLPEKPAVKFYAEPKDASSSYHCYQNKYEWGQLEALENGDYRISIGCWHTYGQTPKSSTLFYPDILDFTFRQDIPEPAIKYERLSESAENNLTIRDNGQTTGGEQTEGLLFSVKLPDGNRIVQAFGHNDNPTEHSKLLLYKNRGSVDSDLPYATAMYDFAEALESEEYAGRDKHCFGAFPFRIGEESFIVLPASYSEESGATFKLAHWNEQSFSSLKTIHTFPADPFPSSATTYDMLRPKVLIVNDYETTDPAPAETRSKRSSSPGATIYAYMPGSGIGAYKVSLGQATVSSLDPVSLSDTTAQPFETALRDRTLSIRPCAPVPGDACARIFSPSGNLAIAAAVSPDTTTDIDLSPLTPGIYLLNLNGHTVKISLR